MYKTSTPARRSAFAAAAAATLSLALAFSTSAIAGPGKPGQNDIVEGGTIIDIALAVNDGGAGEFNGLLSAVLCFGPVDDNPIVDLLSGTDKYTLFAPTDAAFDDLLDRLGETDPCDVDSATLLTVLQYHVVDGRRFSNSVFNAYDSKVIETLAGVDIVSFVDEVDGPTLHDVDEQAVGVVADLININASNGVIHVVDTVLLPIDL
jgi:uncharacterized surface protein with fasciclin (FAS1) repeats